jgi:hypothetical protein
MINWQKLLEESKPCPFCGKRLVEANDHHGEWLEHPGYPRSLCPAGFFQGMDEKDLVAWNSRVEVTNE